MWADCEMVECATLSSASSSSPLLPLCCDVVELSVFFRESLITTRDMRETWREFTLSKFLT